jgi:hypothetical protein
MVYPLNRQPLRMPVDRLLLDIGSVQDGVFGKEFPSNLQANGQTLEGKLAVHRQVGTLAKFNGAVKLRRPPANIS